MKKILMLAGVLGLLMVPLIGNGNATQWVQLSGETNQFYDKDSIICVNGIVTVWIKTQSSQALMAKETGQNKITHVLWLVQYNCVTLEQLYPASFWYRQDGTFGASGYEEGKPREQWKTIFNNKFPSSNEMVLQTISRLMFFCKMCQK